VLAFAWLPAEVPTRNIDKLIVISLDVLDSSGDIQNDIHHDITKIRLDRHGNAIHESRHGKTNPIHLVLILKTLCSDVNKGAAAGHSEDHPPGYCGDCYGAGTPGMCCNTCDSVRDAYISRNWALKNASEIAQCSKEGWVDLVKQQSDDKEGCTVRGFVHVNKVAGNFHFAPGKSYQFNGVHVHDVQGYALGDMDFAHTIEYMRFGGTFNGQGNPLSGVSRDVKERK